MRDWVDLDEYSVDFNDVDDQEFTDEVHRIKRAVRTMVWEYTGALPDDSDFDVEVMAIAHLDEDKELVLFDENDEDSGYIDYCAVVTYLKDYSGFVWVGNGVKEYGDGHMYHRSRKRHYSEREFDTFIYEEFFMPMIQDGVLKTAGTQEFEDALEDAGAGRHVDIEAEARVFDDYFDNTSDGENWIDVGCYYGAVASGLQQLNFKPEEFEDCPSDFFENLDNWGHFSRRDVEEYLEECRG